MLAILLSTAAMPATETINFVTKLNANRWPSSKHVRHAGKAVRVYGHVLVAIEYTIAILNAKNLTERHISPTAAALKTR